MEKPSRYWDLPTALFLVLIVQISAVRLVITAWTPYLYFTLTLAFFGTVLGLALGTSRFQRRTATWLAFGYGIILIPWHLLGAKKSDLSSLDTSYLGQLTDIGGRLWISFGQFFTRKPVDDVLFFIALVSIGYWIIAVTAGYVLTRHGSFLRAVIPAGLAMIIVQGYDSFKSLRLWVLAAYIFMALLILGRMYYIRNRAEWLRGRVFLSPEAAQDLNRQLFVISIMVVLIAWIVPGSVKEWQSAQTSWNKITHPFRDRFSSAVSALKSSDNNGGETIANFYSPILSLGRGAITGKSPVFTVTVRTNPNESPRYYWRGRVYDYYINGTWSNHISKTQDFSPSTDKLESPDPTGRTDTRFTITLKSIGESLLYTPAEPYWVSRPGKVESAITPDQTRYVTAWVAEPNLSAGDDYQVLALTANPTIEKLQAAGTNYPDWITANYLQIPQEISPQVRQLAETVTTGLITPYDKAATITNYLRSNIGYQTTIPKSPSNRDPILWVLFDYKKGFCTYYASAEVLMLRSLGIPARLAVGFAEGQYNENSRNYTVLRGDSHAWPEVYFPGIGWIEFEPTANQTPLDRPSEQPNNTAPIATPLTEDSQVIIPTPLPKDANSKNAAQNLIWYENPTLRFAFFTLMIVLLGVGIFLNKHYSLTERLPVYLADRYVQNGSQPPRWLARWANWSKLTSIEKSFEAINWSLRTLGHPQSFHITPKERADKLRGLLPNATDFIDVLLAEHQTALFTAHAGNVSNARRAGFRIIIETMRARIN